MAVPAFFTAWRGTLPARWRGLVVPYGRAMGVFVASYAGATALFRPWALGRTWSAAVPLAVGLGVCWWLWRPWALLATNSKGESRRIPLLLTWLLCLGLGLSLRAGLYYRLDEVRDLASVRELARPDATVFFRLREAFYAAGALRGHHESFDIFRTRSGTKQYYSTCYIACPLLAATADTAHHHAAPLAWLSYTYQEHLGDDLAPTERDWRRQNFVARCEARFDTLVLTNFAYLERPQNPALGAYEAAYSSPLPTYPDPPLLLVPVQTPFAQRGLAPLGVALGLLLGGSAFITGLLLTMPLRPGSLTAADN